MKKETKPSYGMMAILMTGAFMAILTNTLLNNALPAIMNDLKVSAPTVQWLSSGFMLVNGMVIPATAFLIQKYSVRHLYLCAIGLFAIGTWIGGFAPNFLVLFIARLIQAVGAAVIMPLVMNVLLTTFPIEKRGSAMGLFGLVMVFAPAIGPTLSGWMVQHYHWSALFLMLTPLVLLIYFLAFFKLHDRKEKANIHMDGLSLVLSTIGFGGVLYGFSSAGNEGWQSPVVISTIIIGLFFTVLFIWRQHRIEKPMLNFRIYRSPMYALSSAISITLSISMFSAMLILPIYLQNIRGFTPLESGLLMLPGALIMAVMSPITGIIFDRYGAKILTMTGLSIVLITTYFFTQFSASTNYLTLIMIYSLRMLGISMVMMPVITTGLNCLSKQDYPHGTAMNQTLQQVSGAFGGSLMISIMSTRSQLHAKEMIHSTVLSPYVDWATWKQQMMIHATIKGMNDSFWVATGIAALALILATFLKEARAKKSSAKPSNQVQVVAKEWGSHSS